MKKQNNCALRKGRYSQPNQIYHVTFTCLERRPVFSDYYLAHQAVLSLRQLTPEATTIAFVIMPDHVHWLLRLNQEKTLSQTVQKVKSYIRKRCSSPIWQKGFYDHALRQDEDIKNIARYIIMNPVRAGLCRTVREYPWWDCIYL